MPLGETPLSKNRSNGLLPIVVKLKQLRAPCLTVVQTSSRNFGMLDGQRRTVYQPEPSCIVFLLAQYLFGRSTAAH